LTTGPSAWAHQRPGALKHGVVIGIQWVLLFLLFAQTVEFDYVYFDDSNYVLENPPVRAGLTLDSVRWAFSSF
jgi:hypothetical protein